ncbi:MAG: DNA primase [Clostridiales bacterium]|nr:DNA primase [Clostridiales bacterium]
MEKYFPEYLIAEIKDKNDIVDVISQYIELKLAGTSHKGLCPFHNEKTPSFMVNRERQFFKCFGCGESGDVIGFIMKKESLDFIEAIKVLADRANIHIKERSDLSSKEYREKKEKEKKYFEINKKAGRYFYENLIQRPNIALNYLIKRGLNTKTIKTFGLGYAHNSWNDLLNYFAEKGYTENDLLESGLIVETKQKNGFYDRFRNRIIFPIFDIKGNVLGFGGRVLDESMPKYLNSPETIFFKKSEILYGLNLARKNPNNRQVILVEGYMDVISLYQEGFTNVVATLGTALTKQHGILLKRYFDQVIISFDSDNAGKSATLRSIEILKDLDIDIRILHLPNNMDPDDFIKQKGRQVFQRHLKKALNHIDYKINLAKEKYSSDSLDDQVNLGKEIAVILKDIKSPIEQDAYINKVVEKLKISKEAIIREIQGEKRVTNSAVDNIRYSSNYKRNNRYIEAMPLPEKKGHIIAEKQLLKYMFANPQFTSNVIDKISIDDLIVEKHRPMFQFILDNQHNIDALNKIMDYLPNLEREIQKILEIDIQEVDIDQLIEKYKFNVRRYDLLYKRNELKNKQDEIIKNKNLNKEEVEKQLLDIGMEMMNINIELQKLQAEEGR